MKSIALWRVLFFAFGLVAASLIFSADARGQNQTAPMRSTAADEDFELNINDSRTTETNYKRSTSVEINEANVSVGVGASVQAQKIDLFLRGVTGRVRFRASLEAIRRRIEQANQTRPPNPGNQ
ncbi:MAG TPA: hypothetical protein VF721_22505 [Pyrinomonadaceae bacterium]|jgi:hypothetical protein